jgi:periplasmic copper chaperone A
VTRGTPSSWLTGSLARAGVLVSAVLAVLVAGAGIASAHVTVSSADAAPGGFGALTFRVPNESETASTVGLRISIPEESALPSLQVRPVEGWTVTLTTSDLGTPVRSHGEELATYVSVVEFRAADGGGIRPGEFQEFEFAGGPFPDGGALAFPAVQTYSDGTEVAWIEPAVDGRPEPERPAPVLTLTADTGAAAVPEHAVADTGSSGPGGLALFVAILALLTGVAGVVLGWKAGRRTVSS